MPALLHGIEPAACPQVGVRDLVARGTVRATLRSLVGQLPVVGAVKLSFVRAPQFDYQVRRERSAAQCSATHPATSGGRHVTEPPQGLELDTPEGPLLKERSVALEAKSVPSFSSASVPLFAQSPAPATYSSQTVPLADHPPLFKWRFDQ